MPRGNVYFRFNWLHYKRGPVNLTQTATLIRKVVIARSDRARNSYHRVTLFLSLTRFLLRGLIATDEEGERACPPQVSFVETSLQRIPAVSFNNLAAFARLRAFL